MVESDLRRDAAVAEAARLQTKVAKLKVGSPFGVPVPLCDACGDYPEQTLLGGPKSSQFMRVVATVL